MIDISHISLKKKKKQEEIVQKSFFSELTQMNVKSKFG